MRIEQKNWIFTFITCLPRYPVNITHGINYSYTTAMTSHWIITQYCMFYTFNQIVLSGVMKQWCYSFLWKKIIRKCSPPIPFLKNSLGERLQIWCVRRAIILQSMIKSSGHWISAVLKIYQDVIFFLTINILSCNSYWCFNLYIFMHLFFVFKANAILCVII